MRLRAINIGLAATVILLSIVPGIQGLPKWLQPKHEVNDEMLGPRQYSVYEKPTVTYGGYTYGGYGPAPTLTNIFETSSTIPSSEVSSVSSTPVSPSPASSSETTSSSQTSNTFSSSLSTGFEFSTTTAASSSVGLLASSSTVATESPGALSSSTIVEVMSTAGGAVSSASSLEPSSAPVILTSPIRGNATLITSSEKGSSSSSSAHETSSVFTETTFIAIGTATSLPNFISSIIYGPPAVKSSSGPLSGNTTSSEIGLATSPPSPSTSIIYGSKISGPASSSVISTASGIGNFTSLQSSSIPVAGPSSTPNLGKTTSSGTFIPFTNSPPIVYVSTIVYNESSQSILSSTSTGSSAIGIFTALSSSPTPNSHVLSISGPVASSLPSSVDTPTSPETISTSPSLGITTTAPATTNNGYPINCNHNNCLRALLRSSSLAAEFCATYTISTNTILPTAFPGFVSKCYGSPSVLSSACSCAVSGPATKMPSSMSETLSVIYSLTSLVSARSSSEETSTPVQNTRISSVAVITSTPLGTEISGILPSQSSSSILYTNSTSMAEATIGSVVSGGFSSTMSLLPSPTLPYTASNISTYGLTASGFSILSAVGVLTPLTSSYPLSSMPISPSTSASWYSPIILSSTVPYLGSSTLTNGPTAPGFSTSSAVGIETSLSSPRYPLSGSGTQLPSPSSPKYPANSTAFQVGASGTSSATTIEATSFITETLPAEKSTVVGPQVSYSAPASIVVLSSSGSKGSLPTSTESGETGTSQTGIFLIPSSSSDFGTGSPSRIPHTSGTPYGVSNTSSVYQTTSTGTIPSSKSPGEFTSSAIGFAGSTTPFGNSNSTSSSGPTDRPYSSKSHMRTLHKSKAYSSKTSAGFTSPTPVSSSVLYPVNNQPSLVGPSGTGSMPSSTTFAPVNSTGTQSGILTAHYSVPYGAGSSPSATSTNGGIAISLTSSAPFPIFSVTYTSTSTGTGVAPSFSLSILSTVGLPSSYTPSFSLNGTLSILPTGAGSPVTSTAQRVTGSGSSTISPSSRSVSQDTCSEEYEYPSNTRSSLVPTFMAQSSSQLPASLPSSTLAGSGASGNQISSIPSTFATSYGTVPQRSDSETPSSSYLRLPTSTPVTGITTSENLGFATSLSSASQSVPSQPTSSSAGLTSTNAASPYYYQTSKARHLI